MAKLSKSTRTIIIAAAVLLVLGIVCLVLVMTEPKDEEATSSDTSGTSSAVSESVVITDKEGTEILSLSVENSTGSYTFERKEKVVTSTDDEGNVSSKTEYYWVSPEMGTVEPNSSTVAAFMNCMAGLSTKSLVEENAEDLEKYGLAEPNARVVANFDDGTSAELLFGIQNPAATNYVYFRTADSTTVHQVSYYTVGSAYNAITDFVDLTLTEAYDAENRQELDYLIIERKDLDEPMEISYMYDMEEASEDIESVITTFNSHRFTSPIVAEVDSTVGQTVCYGLYGLSASSCVWVEPLEELLEATGLDDPYCRVTFKYGGKRRVLLLGDEIVTTTETEGEDTPNLTTVVGYYGMFEGEDAIYTFSTSTAPWYTCTVEDTMSRRPISPYIYTIDTLTITTPEQEYVFTVSGDADVHKFTWGEQELPDMSFKSLYQQLISSIGEELFFSEQEYEPYISVRFSYREEYHDVYGTTEDVIEFYQSDDRKSIVRVNGTVLFKVRQIYTERLLSNVEALISGGDVETNW